MTRVRARVLISGLVQGVSFRFAAQRRASRRALTGWVRNRRDGRVELVAEGDDADVRDLIAWCHEGPPGASVEDVDVTWEPPTGEFSTFDIAPSQ